MLAQSTFQVTGDIQRYNSADEDNFTQCGIFFRDVLNKDEKERLVDNIASHICNAQDFLQVKLTPKHRITKNVLDYTELFIISFPPLFFDRIGQLETLVLLIRHLEVC